MAILELKSCNNKLKNPLEWFNSRFEQEGVKAVGREVGDRSAEVVQSKKKKKRMKINRASETYGILSSIPTYA